MVIQNFVNLNTDLDFEANGHHRVPPHLSAHLLAIVQALSIPSILPRSRYSLGSTKALRTNGIAIHKVKWKRSTTQILAKKSKVLNN
jgi:hypothetical protein